MEQWDVFLVLVEIVGFLAVVLSFSSKFNQTLGEFRATISELKEAVKSMKRESRETHKDIFEKLDDHETRISHLEIDKKEAKK